MSVHIFGFVAFALVILGSLADAQQQQLDYRRLFDESKGVVEPKFSQQQRSGDDSGYWCYACSSLSRPNCEVVNPLNTTVKHCTNGNVCVSKFVTTTSGQVITIRDCVESCASNNLPNLTYSCWECQTNLCNTRVNKNSATTLTAPLACITAAIIASLQLIK